MKAFLGAAALCWVAMGPAVAQTQEVVFTAWVQTMIENPAQWKFGFDCRVLNEAKPYCTYSFTGTSTRDNEYILMVRTDLSDRIIARDGCEFLPPYQVTRECFHLESMTNTFEAYDTHADVWVIQRSNSSTGFPLPPSLQQQIQPQRRPPQYRAPEPPPAYANNQQRKLLALLDR